MSKNVRTARPEQPRLRVWMHLLMQCVAESISFIGLMALIIYVCDDLRSALGPLMLLLVAPIGFGALYLTRAAFQRIPARCRRCGGRAFSRGFKSHRYECADCGYDYDNGISTNV